MSVWMRTRFLAFVAGVSQFKTESTVLLKGAHMSATKVCPKKKQKTHAQDTWRQMSENVSLVSEDPSDLAPAWHICQKKQIKRYPGQRHVEARAPLQEDMSTHRQSAWFAS